MNRRLFVLTTIALLFGTVLFTGCDSTPEPNVVISDGSTYDFGQVTLGQSKSKTFTVSNKGDMDATLGETTAVALGLSAPFAVTGGTCASGTMLGANEANSCTIIVTFTPSAHGEVNDMIELAVMGEGYTGTAKRALRGMGYLDCNSTPALAQSYDDGSSDASARNTQEAAAGKIAGEALTYNDGYVKGYSETYATAYDNGWSSTYNSGYDTGYNEGYFDGLNDSYSCSIGSSAGATDGYNDGESDGQWDGYNAGYNDGYATGYADGYDSGYWDGVASCPTASPAKKRASSTSTHLPRIVTTNGADPLDTQENLQVCYDRGYAHTYDPNAYWNAYYAAAAVNAAYQSGLSAGRAQGTSDGRADGEYDGYQAGRADGDADGWADGTAIAYDECYLDSYNLTYSSGYYDGYESTFYGYPAGYSSGDYDGYYAGYDDGFQDGQFEYCPLRLAASATRPRVYGLNQKWARVKNGITVGAYARRPMPLLKFLTSAQKSRIESVRSEARSRALNERRPLLRVELMRAPKSRD